MESIDTSSLLNTTSSDNAQGNALLEFLSGSTIMFYGLGPSKLEYNDVDEVPDFVEKAVPYFIIMVVLEWVIGLGRGIKTYDWKV